MIARYPTLTEVVTKMKIAIIVWVLVLGVLEDMDVLVHRVLLHLAVIPFERMDWVTVLIKVVNILPQELGLFLDPKGIRSNLLARRNQFQMMAGYTREQFEVRIRRSSKTRYEAGCKDGECEFQLRAFKMQKGEYWVVRMFLKDHTCNIDGFHSCLRQENSWTVGELLAPKLQVHGHSLKPKDIMVESNHRLKEVNPGTITAIKTNVANKFEYMFIAYAASLHGFQTVIRPVIAIDGTHLKAICLDANNQVFPLAYGFGDIEDEMSWSWFLNELKNAIGSPDDCMIISDRHLGIKVAMEKVYPNVPHGYCVFHMAQNIKNDYKRKDVSLLFKQAWNAYRKSDFKEVMLEMMKVNRATELIKERNKDSEKYTVLPIDSVNFNVKDGNKDGLMNLSEKTCSCTKFQVDKLPCRHALAAIRYAKKPFQDFCEDCYKTTSWLEAYSGNIFPVGHPSDWNIPQDVRSKVVHLPPFRAQVGRLKKMRFKSVEEHANRKTRNCTICKKSGHNRQNCKNAQPCQAPQPCPSATSVTSATSKRPRRPYSYMPVRKDFTVDTGSKIDSSIVTCHKLHASAI
ncbi:hypothetical protein Dsin_001949 [Dipteronia sinensis]|uniref:SWIM-type domain-containing protein n=1 Tax=Dipteronia sinensis TaxID=43782 RepID=A0AAE0B4Y5_9ROSI|nr:hypothetical protein Dsin_001949 [Dipteronia sinensis]